MKRMNIWNSPSVTGKSQCSLKWKIGVEVQFGVRRTRQESCCRKKRAGTSNARQWKRNVHGLENYIMFELEKCTSLFIFILFQGSSPSRYSYRRPYIPCPICTKPSCTILYISNMHFPFPWHLCCKAKLFICMKTASLSFTRFYEKCKLADFPYEHMDLVDKAISST